MRHLAILLLLTSVAALGACAAPLPPKAGFLVPSAGIIHNQTARVHPDQILPGSDGDYDFPRGEKIAYGPSAVAEGSAYTIYTSDVQAISIRNSGGTGYRYRWSVQSGTTVP